MFILRVFLKSTGLYSKMAFVQFGLWLDGVASANFLCPLGGLSTTHTSSLLWVWYHLYLFSLSLIKILFSVQKNRLKW
jgi:hypothetical protein